MRNVWLVLGIACFALPAGRMKMLLWVCCTAALMPSSAAIDATSAGESSDTVLEDVSRNLCWSGDYSLEGCCRGDATTHPKCWDGFYSFSECCPNSDCWIEDEFTYEMCCGQKYGAGGNPACWSGVFSFDLCCMANASAISWVEAMVGGIDTDKFYAMDEFYTDAQYGDDFGYYSTGRVLRAQPAKTEHSETQQFAHFTTYPMVLSPHFARVVCRLLFVMWIHLKERTPFRVVEMGAGSGQLSVDVQKCVRANELGITPRVWRRWAAAFEYLIMERSPALAQRQRDRGLRVVAGDAQSLASCRPVLAALAMSPACSGPASRESPECVVSDRGTSEAGASVVLSNELLDAFAPVKLRLSLYGDINVTDCSSWQEMRLAHVIQEDILSSMSAALGNAVEQMEATLSALRSYTSAVFCGMANSTIGREARERLPANASCIAVALGLSELLNHLDLRVPAASHNMRLLLRKDQRFWGRLRQIVDQLELKLQGSVVLPRDIYRQYRHLLRNNPGVEVQFLVAVNTYQIPVTIVENRCKQLTWWFQAHQSRILRLGDFYKSLGYPAVHLVVRPGERDFIDLVDCLLGPTGGFKISIDYGATFEALGHSLTINPEDDGIFVPPIPHELMQGLPNCHQYWPKCAGVIDWTTMVDFTNLAAAGEQLGWRTSFYGPQGMLEQMGQHNLSVGGSFYTVPGYSVLSNTWMSRHVRSWYGSDAPPSQKEGETLLQRWTSFKALILEKPGSDVHETPPVIFPSWHLDTQDADACWAIDPTTVPLADWIPRQGQSSSRKALETLTGETNDRLGREYIYAYEEVQLAVHMVDWLVATGGCDSLRSHRLQSLTASQGLWLNLQRRLQRSWGEAWGYDVLRRISDGILQRLLDPGASTSPSSPPICSGFQVYTVLCEPGDAKLNQFHQRLGEKV